MARKPIYLLLALVMFVSYVPDSWGYAYLSQSRWRFQKMPIPWYVTYSESSNWRGRSKEQLEKMAKQAFGMWENINCSFMMFRYMGVTPTGSNKGDGLNTIEWVASLPSNAPASAIGLGGPLSSGGSIHEGNVWIKAMERSDDFISIVIAHEVGHAIALGHTDVKTSIMYPSSSGNTQLTQDDKDGLCNAYPISANSCARDEHCPTGLICREQVCTKCKSDSDCGSDNYCDKELCVPKCKSDDDCQPKGRICVANRCENCQKDDDCGSDRFCKDALCNAKCKTDDDCSADSSCRENGRCVKRGGCVTNQDCKEGEFCQNEKCVSQGALGKSCDTKQACDASHECPPHVCTEDLDCKEGFSCEADEDGDKYCVNSEKKKDSVCALVCKGKGEVKCPAGFVCRAFTRDASYCYPEKRTVKPTNPPDDTPDPKTGGCSTMTPDGNMDMTTALLALFCLAWCIRLRRS